MVNAHTLSKFALLNPIASGLISSEQTTAAVQIVRDKPQCIRNASAIVPVGVTESPVIDF
jgi:hypothetical protein